MKKEIALIALLASLVLISGCVQQPQGSQVCGNNVCDSGETIESCPADCEAPPMPAAPGAEGTPPSLPF